MSRERHPLLRAAAIAELREHVARHPLNPAAEVHMRTLSRRVGMTRLGVHLARLPPDREAFIYHSHHREEEFLFVLSGRGIAEIDDETFEIGEGDFLGFAAPSAAHHLRNPFDRSLVYLLAGENLDVEIGDLPRERKRVIRVGREAWVVSWSDLEKYR